VPVVMAGHWIMERVPMTWTRRIAFALFVAFGIVAVMTL